MERVQINHNMDTHYERMNVLNEVLVHFVEHDRINILYKDLITFFKDLLPTFTNNITRTAKYNFSQTPYEVVTNNDTELGEFVCYCVERFIESGTFKENEEASGLRMTTTGYHNGVAMIKQREFCEKQEAQKQNIRKQIFASIKE